MTRDIEGAKFEGKPLSSFRGLGTDFFLEKYILEEEVIDHPEPFISEGIPRLEDHVYRTETKLKSKFENYRLGNPELPVSAHRQEILDAVRNNLFTIITGPTGSGKSTQLPQILINDGYEKVYLTQPRIVAARNIADRITCELADLLGEDEANRMVRFRSANESKGPSDAVIDVVTDGLQLVVELNSKDDNLQEVLIIDEAHESNSNIEFLIASAKRSKNRRVIVMSATMDAHELADYLADAVGTRPPIIEIEGRTHAVELIEKPDSNVVEETLSAIPKLLAETVYDENAPNGILVFLPGLREINDFIDTIKRRLPPEIAQYVTINALHSKLSAEEQQKALKKYKGMVNIIAATNVAQTSLTIAHIKNVIDSGFERQVERNDEGVEGLVLNPISQADCDQRAGRAGRVCPGIYTLTKLNDIEPHIAYINRNKFPVPEILRTDIMRNTLRVAAIDLNITELDLYHKVSLPNMLRALDNLRILGALDENNKITKIGRSMNEFPLSPSSARMMVEANIKKYSNQVKAYMAAITASVDSGGLQYFGYNVGRRWNELTEETSSDLLVQLDIFIASQDMPESEMIDYNLDIKNITKARKQYRKIADKVGALEDNLLAPKLEEREDLKRCIYAGMVNNIYKSVGSGYYVPLKDSTTLREVSNRSLVSNNHQILFGKPYRVEIRRDGELEEKHIIQGLTVATLRDLGRLALDYEWQTKGLIMRNGMFVKVVRQMLYGLDLGIEKEISAEPSPLLRQEIIEHVLDNPGPQQIKLRGLKSEIESLAHLAKDHVKLLTHDMIKSLISFAAPEDITDPTIIDNNLRLIKDGYMQVGEFNDGIKLETFVDAERQALIKLNAPEEVEVEGVNLRVTYRNRKALVKNYTVEEIAKLSEEVFLADKRQIYFQYGTKHCTLIELKDKLGIESYSESI